MPLKVMYHEIAGRYAMANRFGSISDSHRCAINQIIQNHLGETPGYKVLDLGVGNGSFLHQLKQHMPLAEFTGIDISKDMLKHAEEILPLKTIEGSATHASEYLPLNSQNLVLAHFINAYIPIHALFNQAHLLACPNGYFSLITTTYDSFPIAQQQLAEFIAQDSLLSSIVGHYYKAIVRNTTVATNENELMQSFDNHQFQIIDHQRLHIPITLNNIDELALFGIEGTWFLNSISIRMLPKNFLIQRLKRLFNRIFTFPYQDTHIIDVVLAKKIE
jgi:ubiquinone/menaquinone biosynthesis C-methylase UbiE